MELRLLAIPVADAGDLRSLLALLRRLGVPMDPCAGNPRVEADQRGRRQLLVVANPLTERRLRDAGRAFEVVHDFADHPDPRNHVSLGNRFADLLARARASRPRR